MSFTETDVSGNGNDGTYFSRPYFVPGLVPGDTAWAVSGGSFVNEISVPDATISWLTAWTFELWTATVVLTPGSLWLSTGPGSPDHGTVDIHLDAPSSPGNRLTVTDQGGFNNWHSSATAIPNDGNPHHIVITYDGTSASPTVLLYVDDSLLTWSATGGGIFSPAAPVAEALAGNGAGDITFDEFAVYPSALSGGQISAHYAAAASSFADYTAAVLGDSPAVYYHLNGNLGGWHVGCIGVG